MDKVKIHEPLGNSDRNQIHFYINVKSESKNKKTYTRNFHKGNYKDMRKYLAKQDWNKMLMNKLMFKQTMWIVYRRTRKDEDYANYKEALNAATTEIRQSKRSYEQKQACNIKNDSKNCYAYVRSKQNVQDKVGRLEDNVGNIM